MKTLIFSLIIIFFMLNSNFKKAVSQTSLPIPDHVVIAIFESVGYSQLIGSTAAPYINTLANDTLSALFTESYAQKHPSQPNYLILYSGSTQGVTNDGIPAGIPFTTENFGRQLIDSGKTFITYSEDLPSVGFDGATSGLYARKHNPAANWIGTGTNQIPDTTNQPFTAFSSIDFELLPTVCYVVPNLENDMHNGTAPAKITTGDEWISKNLNSYIQWAKTHNSLFILTFDEENGTIDNHIATIFCGQMVKPGQYSNRITHYSILHTLEEMYGLPFIGDSLDFAPISGCWNTDTSTALSNNLVFSSVIYPNPCKETLIVELSNYKNTRMEFYNTNGQLINTYQLHESKTEISMDNLKRGLYIVKVISREGVVIKKIIKN